RRQRRLGPGLAQRLTHFRGQQTREVVLRRADLVRRPPQHRRSLPRRRVRPAAAVKRLPRRLDRGVDVLFARLRELRDRYVVVGWIAALHHLSGLGSNLLAVDEQLVLLAGHSLRGSRRSLSSHEAFLLRILCVLSTILPPECKRRRPFDRLLNPLLRTST